VKLGLEELEAMVDQMTVVEKAISLAVDHWISGNF
jgi:hypothetical protein